MKQPLTSSFIAIKSLKSGKKKVCSEVCILITQKLVLHKGLCPHPCKMEKNHISSSPSCQAGIFTLAFSPQSIHRNAWCCWEGTAFKNSKKKKKKKWSRANKMFALFSAALCSEVETALVAAGGHAGTTLLYHSKGPEKCQAPRMQASKAHCWS